MTELSKHIGENIDIPAGDIGVGGREISFMFGQFKRLKNEFTGSMTGKGLEYGGSLIRKEATGYGCAYFMEEMLKHRGETLKGKSCIVSGSGNVALYTAEKLIDLGAKVVTLSDSGGFIHVAEGITQDRLNGIIELKTMHRGRLSELADETGIEYHAGKTPWTVQADLAFPCATQNEIDEKDARVMVKNKIGAVAEGPTCQRHRKQSLSCNRAACCLRQARLRMPEAWRFQEWK